MKVLFTVLFVCLTSLNSTPFTSAQDAGDFYYSRRYDNIDINNIFRSRLLNHYVDCLLDRKPCPPEGKDLKSKFLLKSGTWRFSKCIINKYKESVLIE